MLIAAETTTPSIVMNGPFCIALPQKNVQAKRKTFSVGRSWKPSGLFRVRCRCSLGFETGVGETLSLTKTGGFATCVNGGGWCGEDGEMRVVRLGGGRGAKEWDDWKQQRELLKKRVRGRGERMVWMDPSFVEMCLHWQKHSCVAGSAKRSFIVVDGCVWFAG